MPDLPAYPYHSFLLRLWQAGEGTGWRASLEDTRTGQKQLFPNILNLVFYLMENTDEAEQPISPPEFIPLRWKSLG